MTYRGIDNLISEIDGAIQQAQEEGIQLNVSPENDERVFRYQQRIKSASRQLYFTVSRDISIEQEVFEKGTDALIRGAEVMGVSQEGIFQDQRVCGIVEMALNQAPPLTIPYRFEQYLPVCMSESLSRAVQDRAPNSF